MKAYYRVNNLNWKFRMSMFLKRVFNAPNIIPARQVDCNIVKRWCGIEDDFQNSLQMGRNKRPSGSGWHKSIYDRPAV